MNSCPLCPRSSTASGTASPGGNGCRIGPEAEALEPILLLRFLNTIRLELQTGEVLDFEGSLAAWVIRPEANLTESNLRSADASVRTLGQKTGRDRNHLAFQSADTAKVRLRSRLTQRVSALQIAGTEAPPPLPNPIEAPPPPVASAPPPPAPAPGPAAPAAAPTKPKQYPVTDEVVALALEKPLAAIRACGFKAAGIGAIAHLAWGSRKTAKRIELLLSSTPSQRGAILMALRAEGLEQVPDGRPLQHRYVDEERGAAAPVNLSEASTPPLKQLLARSQTGLVDDLERLVASSEDLIFQCIGSDLPEDVEYAVELLRYNLP